MADSGVPSMWYSILNTTSNGAFYWYAGTTQIMALVNLAAGTRRLDLTAGTVTNPAISAGLNSSDTNTGIYFPAADTIGFVEGGAEVMRINSSGNVGIGTTAQTALLQLNSAGSTTTGAAQLYISGSTLNRIDFATAGVAAPATTTRSAGTKITLYPSVDASNVDYGLGVLAGALWYSVPTATSSHWHAFYGGTTERMRIMGDGQIRLGTGSVSLPVISAGLNSSDTNTGVYFPDADTIGFVEGGVEAMRINSSGNVGIGTTAQTARLQVHTTGSTVLGQSQLYLSGSTLVRIDLAGNGTDTPKFSATTDQQRSVGEKINLYPKIALFSGGCKEYLINITTNQGVWTAYQAIDCGSTTPTLSGPTLFSICGLEAIEQDGGNNYLPPFTGLPAGITVTESSSGNCQTVDYSIGVFDTTTNYPSQLWYTVPASNVNYAHSFYGGVTELLRIRGNGQTSFQGGSVSLPVISAGLNSGDTNTGIYFPAADSIGFATSGTSRGIINNDGYGIQTSPSNWIHLSSDPANSKHIRIDAQQNVQSPLTEGYSPDTAIKGFNGADPRMYLSEPYQWIEIQIYNDEIVLIPCYLPE